MCWQLRAALGPTHARKQNSVSEMKLVHSWYCSDVPKLFPKTRPPTVRSRQLLLFTRGWRHTRVAVTVRAVGVCGEGGARVSDSLCRERARLTEFASAMDRSV
jgi:hypothetical protein